MGPRPDKFNNTSKIDRKDDLIDYQDLLEIASQTRDLRATYIKKLMNDQELYERRIRVLTQQRAQQILLKDILTKSDNPKDTLKTYRPSVFHVPSPVQNLEKFDYTQVYGPNPSFDLKTLAQEEIRDVIRGIDIAIRDIDFELSKADLFERRLSYLIKKLQAQEGAVNKARIRNGTQFQNFSDNVADINNVISKINSLIFVLEDIPEEFTTLNEAEKFNAEFNQKSFAYTLERRAVLEITEDYIEDFPEQAVALPIFQYVNSLPIQITTVIPQRKEVLEVLNSFIRDLTNQKIVIKEKLNAMAQERPNAELNKRVKDLQDELNTQLASDAINEIVDRSATSAAARQYANRLKENFDKSIRRFREELKNIGAETRSTSILLDKYKYQFLRSVSLLKVFVDEERTGEKSLEEYWREKKRKKYGADLPFCDEVKMPDGSFAKKTDVIFDQASGTYIRKQDLRNQDIIDQNLANHPRERI